MTCVACESTSPGSMANRIPSCTALESSPGLINEGIRSPLCALVSSYYGTTSLHVAASELIIRSSPELAPACLSKAPPPAVSLAHRGNHNPILSTVRFLGHSPQVAEGMCILNPLRARLRQPLSAKTLF